MTEFYPALITDILFLILSAKPDMFIFEKKCSYHWNKHDTFFSIIDISELPEP